MELSDLMESSLHSYVKWYITARAEFCQRVYIDRSTWLKRKLMPFADWDCESVMSQEVDFSIAALSELKKRELAKHSLSLASLTLSNRSEYISDQADAFTTFASLIVVMLAFFSLTLSPWLKLVVASVAFCGLVWLLLQRIELRGKVACYKEIINLLKQYESRHA
jgi:O6-methylguanine-DNA--protein-cysteine methyltransferase